MGLGFLTVKTIVLRPSVALSVHMYSSHRPKVLSVHMYSSHRPKVQAMAGQCHLRVRLLLCRCNRSQKCIRGFLSLGLFTIKTIVLRPSVALSLHMYSSHRPKVLSVHM